MANYNYNTDKIQIQAIDERTAREAALSYRIGGDYTEGEATRGYEYHVAQFEQAVAELVKRLRITPTAEQEEQIAYYTARYRAKLAEAINRNNAITARCPSVAVAGPANFPVRKKEKQIAAWDKHWSEYGEFYNPTENRYFNRIRSILSNNVIYSDDGQALEKLYMKLEKEQEQHDRMIAANAHWKKHGTMAGFEGITEEKAVKLDEAVKNGWLGPIPYAAYEITNSNNRIKQVKQRIAELEKMKGREQSESEYPATPGVEVNEDKDLMRIQLIFDGKPDGDVREVLKRNGFRWAPSQGAWQRQLTANGIYATKRTLEQLKPLLEQNADGNTTTTTTSTTEEGKNND